MVRTGHTLSIKRFQLLLLHLSGSFGGQIFVACPDFGWHLVGCQAISYKLLQPLRGPGMVHYIRTVETPDTPDEPDVLDAGDAMQGLG